MVRAVADNQPEAHLEQDLSSSTMVARCACEITSYDGQRARGAESAARVGVRSAGWRLRQRPPSERAEQAGAATVVAPKRPEQQRPEQQRPEPSTARSHGAIAAPEAHGGAKRGQAPPDLKAQLAIAAPAEAKAAAEVRAPAEAKAAAENQVKATASLEAQVKALLQAGAPAEARTLLLTCGERGAPLTEFYLGVCVSQLEGEAAALFNTPREGVARSRRRPPCAKAHDGRSFHPGQARRRRASTTRRVCGSCQGCTPRATT